MSAPVEVLMWNLAGELTEGSITSVYLRRDGQWVTPSASSGGQRGTTRRWAIEQGLCVEGIIPKDTVRNGEDVWVSNGVRGFGYGRVVIPENEQSICVHVNSGIV